MFEVPLDSASSALDARLEWGYKFLMRCYQDDDIFLFGFSRGAYVARFLAEMLDHVGLLSKGNEEMYVFASAPKPRERLPIGWVSPASGTYATS